MSTLGRPLLALAASLSLHPIALACSSPASNAMELVPLSAVTHAAVTSGDWSSPTTWGGAPPVDGARVHIPAGLEVVVDDVVLARLETVRIDGTLAFATDVDTGLQVDTLVSTGMGTLEIGTAADPVGPDVTAQVRFVDDGPLDLACDPKQLGRGAMLMGRTEVVGAARTHRAVLAVQPRAGDTTLELDVVPQGWQVGDELVVTGTVAGDPESDELRIVTAIQGGTVTLDAPLARDHVAPKPDLDVYVGNTTRNVVFTSESLRTDRRGHVMFMNADTDVANALFADLGRTDKTRPLDDWIFEFPEDVVGNQTSAPVVWQFREGRRTNVRGRYPVHFHRTGTDPTTAPAVVRGSVVREGPGWGFVVHSSHVHLLDNVSYGLQGAGFYTEAGDEVGRMQGNLAVRSVNDAFTLDDGGAIDPDLRQDRMDYGNDGDGYWLTGNRMALVDNVAAGASAHGFVFWTDGIVEVDLPQPGRSQVLAAHVPNGHLLGNRQAIPTWWAPLAEVRDNVAYGATIGFRARYIHANIYLGEGESPFHQRPPQAYVDTLTPTFDGLTLWNNRDGLLLNYNERIHVRNARIVGIGAPGRINGGTANTGVGLDLGTQQTDGPGRIDDVSIEGFRLGFVAPRNGQWAVDGLELRNRLDLYVAEARSGPRAITMDRVTFGSLAGTAVATGGGPRQFGVIEADLDLFMQPFSFLLPDRITVNGTGLYFDQQRDGVVPLRRAPDPGDLVGPVPDLLVGMTNAQMDALFGGSYRGSLLPGDARRVAGLSGGWIGSPAPAATVFPPLYDMTGEGESPMPTEGTTVPEITGNRLRIEPGQTRVLLRSNLNTLDTDTTPDGLFFSVSGVQRGFFAHRDAPTSPISGFTQAELDGGVIRFVHDGSLVAPTYTVTVTDGTTTTVPSTVVVDFAP